MEPAMVHVVLVDGEVASLRVSVGCWMLVDIRMD